MTDFFEHLQSISEKIQTIDAVEALEHHKCKDICFVDLRDGFELREYGVIPGAKHCPRGSLEFRIPASSDYHHSFFTSFKRFVFYCSHGQRSILATDTAGKLGLDNVSHIRGGMVAWVKSGGATARWLSE